MPSHAALWIIMLWPQRERLQKESTCPPPANTSFMAIIKGCDIENHVHKNDHQQVLSNVNRDTCQHATQMHVPKESPIW